MVGGTFGIAAVGALFQHLSDDRLAHRLGDLPLSSQQQALSAAVAVVGVLIAFASLRDSRAPARRPAGATTVPLAHRPD